MAVVEPIRPVRAGGLEDADRVNVVRLIEFLGPVSPELVLVDPGLADRARALLPDSPGIRMSRRREHVEPTLLGVPALPSPRRSSTSMAVVALVASALAATTAIGWWAGRSGREALPTIESTPPVAAPALSSPDASPGPPPPNAPPIGPTAVQAPRFVWPAESGSVGYRVALYQDGQQIFERDVTRSALELPKSWTYQGRPYQLTKGAYRWVVWPLVGPEKRLGRAIVSAQYVV